MVLKLVFAEALLYMSKILIFSCRWGWARNCAKAQFGVGRAVLRPRGREKDVYSFFRGAPAPREKSFDAFSRERGTTLRRAA
ncbi:MAG: hypothetical protein [Cressdnaviricota sp.]|nr:MAG: hypothetical protein [Cressdnaviricota sp.]